MVKVNLKTSPYNLDDTQIAWVEETLKDLSSEEKLDNSFSIYFH